MLEIKKRKVLRKYGIDLWGVLHGKEGNLERSRFVNFFFELYKEQFLNKLRFKTGMYLVLSKYLEYRKRYRECFVRDKFLFSRLFPFINIRKSFCKRNKIKLYHFFMYVKSLYRIFLYRKILRVTRSVSRMKKYSLINIKHKQESYGSSFYKSRFRVCNYFSKFKSDLSKKSISKNKVLLKYKFCSFILYKFRNILKIGYGGADSSLFSEFLLSRLGVRRTKVLKNCYSKWFFKVKRLLLFYNNLKFCTVRQLCKLSGVSRRGNSRYFLSLLERRLDSIVLRSNFFRTKFEVKKNIVLGNILVNGNKVTYCNYITKANDIISVCVSKRREVLFNLIKHLKSSRNSFVLKAPDYLEVNYKTLSCVVIPKYIEMSNVFFPFEFTGNSNIKMLYKTKN